MRSCLLPLGAALAGAPLAAQPGAELKMPPIVAPPACDTQGLDIVVCGRRVPADRYRIPPEFRDDRTNPVNPSWSARARDERETGRYDGQTVGPAGAFSQWTGVVCQWRAERQQLAGHPPDCTRRVRPPGN